MIRSLTGLAVLLLTVAADAQRFRGNSPYTRNAKSIRKVMSPAVRTASRATVRIQQDDTVVALGTVVAKGGLILTKASEVEGQDIEVRFGAAGEPIAARRVGVDETNDLLLLRIDREDLPVAKLQVQNETRVGSFVVTAAPRRDDTVVPLAYGVMSVRRHPRPGPNQKVGYLGVRVMDAPLRLTDVVDGSAAARAGLHKADLVLALDGRSVRNSARFSRTIKRKKPGDELRVQVRRGDETLDVVATLGRNSDRRGPISDQEKKKLWGPLSDVRLGFEEVIQHDSVLRPQDCGGPLCNLDGEVVGINIARVGRFETLALTSKVVARSLRRILDAAETEAKKK